ncbi:MAG TPA: DUF2784 domain-containing protein [Gemmatimonadaceae bacterium]
MFYRWLADAVVVLHTSIVVFVVLGGFLVWRWRRLALLHIPLFIWGVLVEYASWICPLTPLENALRHRAGDAGYAGGFVEHYFIPVLYPAGLTTNIQRVLGTTVLLVNAVAYGGLILRMRRSRRAGER